jgi:hypothetical protein
MIADKYADCDLNEILTSALELAENAVHAAQGGEYEREQAEFALRDLLEAVDGVRPSETEVSLLVAEVLGQKNTKYYLCDATTRERLDGFPDLYEEPECGEELAERGIIVLDSATYDAEEKEREDKRRAMREAEYTNRQRQWSIERANRGNAYGMLMYDELAAYAAANGKQWRAKLRRQWRTGTAPGELQRLSTIPYFVETGLAKFKIVPNLPPRVEVAA